MAIDTLLFDLDGTLVDQFLPGSHLQFASLLIRRFRGLAPGLKTWRSGIAAIRAMQRHETDRTNFDVLVSEFCRLTNVPFDETAGRLLKLAQDDFPAMGWRFKPVPGAPETV